MHARNHLCSPVLRIEMSAAYAPHYMGAAMWNIVHTWDAWHSYTRAVVHSHNAMMEAWLRIAVRSGIAATSELTRVNQLQRRPPTTCLRTPPLRLRPPTTGEDMPVHVRPPPVTPTPPPSRPCLRPSMAPRLTTHLPRLQELCQSPPRTWPQSQTPRAPRPSWPSQVRTPQYLS